MQFDAPLDEEVPCSINREINRKSVNKNECPTAVILFCILDAIFKEGFTMVRIFKESVLIGGEGSAKLFGAQ
jgi:hypothetical protein